MVRAGLDKQEAEVDLDEILSDLSRSVNKALGILDELQKKFPALF